MTIQRRVAAFWFAAAFIAAQAVVLHHTTAYGSEPHEHGDHTCVVQALAKTFGGIALTASAALPVPATGFQKTVLPARIALRGIALTRPHIRGPPELSA